MGLLLHHLRPRCRGWSSPLVLGENCPIPYIPSHRAQHGQEELGLLNKQLFNILFSPHCSTHGLKPSPALNTEPVVSLTGFSTGSPRAAARQFTSTLTVKHPRFPNWTLRNGKSELQLLVSLGASVKIPKGLVFWATLHVQSTTPAGAPCCCALPELLQLRSQAHTLGGEKKKKKKIII